MAKEKTELLLAYPTVNTDGEVVDYELLKGGPRGLNTQEEVDDWLDANASTIPLGNEEPDDPCTEAHLHLLRFVGARHIAEETVRKVTRA